MSNKQVDTIKIYTDGFRKYKILYTVWAFDTLHNTPKTRVIYYNLTDGPTHRHSRELSSFSRYFHVYEDNGNEQYLNYTIYDLKHISTKELLKELERRSIND